MGATTVALSAGALLFEPLWGHVAGWLLGSIFTATLVVAYRVSDRRASQHPRYVRDRRLGRLANALLIAGLVLGSVNAFSLATELAK